MDLGVEVEQEHVHKVYSQIASHFSDTRFKPWPRIAQFLTEQPVGSLIADVGCGNGKYLGVNPSTYCIGSDICPELVSIASDRDHEVAVCDCLSLPYLSGAFDAVICIAVIHHLSTEERRVCALREMARVLRPGGHMLVYVWAMEQQKKKFDAQDVMVPWHLQPKYTQGTSQGLPKSSRDVEKVRERKRLKKEQKKKRKMETGVQRKQGSSSAVPVDDVCDMGCLFDELPSLDCPKGVVMARDGVISTETKSTYADKDSTRSQDGITDASAHAELRGTQSDATISCTKLTESSSVYSQSTDTNTADDSTIESCKLNCPMPTEATCSNVTSTGPYTVKCVTDTSTQRKCIDDDQAHTSKGLEERGYQTFQRYYHVFRQGELVKLIAKIDCVTVIEEYFDHENWCVIARKHQ